MKSPHKSATNDYTDKKKQISPQKPMYHGKKFSHQPSSMKDFLKKL